MVKSRARGGALALVVSAALAGCGGDEGSEDASTARTSSTSAQSTPASNVVTTVAPGTTTTTRPGTVVSVTVRGGSVDGPSRQRVTLNEQVTVRVTSDVADEVHVHGYDRTAPVGPGQIAEIRFAANIPGVFEVEFERSRRVLFTLEVRP